MVFQGLQHVIVALLGSEGSKADGRKGQQELVCECVYLYPQITFVARQRCFGDEGIDV